MDSLVQAAPSSPALPFSPSSRLSPFSSANSIWSHFRPDPFLTDFTGPI